MSNKKKTDEPATEFSRLYHLGDEADTKQEATLADNYDSDVKANLHLFGELMVIFISKVYQEQITKHSKNMTKVFKPWDIEELINEIHKHIPTVTKVVANLQEQPLKDKILANENERVDITPAILQAMNTMLIQLLSKPDENLHDLNTLFKAENYAQLNLVTAIWVDVLELLAEKTHDDFYRPNFEHAILLALITRGDQHSIYDVIHSNAYKECLPIINKLERHVFEQLSHTLPVTGDPKAKLQSTIQNFGKDSNSMDKSLLRTLKPILAQYLGAVGVKPPDRSRRKSI